MHCAPPLLPRVVPVIRHVARVSEDSKVTIDTEEYVNSFTASMMEATFAWSNGANFCEVCALCAPQKLVVFFYKSYYLAWSNGIITHVPKKT